MCYKNAFQWDAHRPLIDRMPGGGCLLWRGLLPGGSPSGGSPSQGVPPSWGVPPFWGVSFPGGGIPACTEADPPLLTESQTPVKTFPWPNFVAAGKNGSRFGLHLVIEIFQEKKPANMKYR